MAQMVELDMDALAGEISPALLADMREAELQMKASELAELQMKMDGSIGGGLKREDFRQHAQGTFDGVALDGVSLIERGAPGHWLLGTVYGRDVLKAYLLKMDPDIQVSKWRAQPELDEKLEFVVDALGLRELKEPKTISDRIQYLARMAKLLLDVEDADQGMAIA